MKKLDEYLPDIRKATPEAIMTKGRMVLLRDVLRSALEEMREECAKMAEDDENPHRSPYIADAIRSIEVK